MKKCLCLFLCLFSVLMLLSGCNSVLGMVEETHPVVLESAKSSVQTSATEIYSQSTDLMQSVLFSETEITSRKVGFSKVGPSGFEQGSTEKITRAPGRTFSSFSKGTIYKTGEKFFDDVVFVGDSVSLGLKNYVTKQRNSGKKCLGEAKFLVAGSMGYTNSLSPIGTPDSVHPKYQGKEVLIADGVNKIGAKKVFIMLGLNDFCAYTIEYGIKNAEKSILRIAESNPDVRIYVQSVTPVIKAKEHGNFNNARIDAFNEGLKTLCRDNGWNYVDVASVMKGSDNCFINEYCGDSNDQGVHMSAAGYRAWIDFLVNKYC